MPLRERVSSHPLPIRRSAIQPPSGSLMAQTKYGKRSVQPCLQNRQMPHRYKVVGKPGDEQVPVIIKTEKAQTNTNQVPAAKMPRTSLKLSDDRLTAQTSPLVVEAFGKDQRARE